MWFELFFFSGIIILAVAIGVYILVQFMILLGLLRGLWMRQKPQNGTQQLPKYDAVAAQKAWEEYMKVQYELFILENAKGGQKP